jgi:hypothetical protein
MTWWTWDRAGSMLYRNWSLRSGRHATLRVLLAERRLRLETCLAAADHDDQAALADALPALRECEQQLVRLEPEFVIRALLPLWERYEEDWIEHPQPTQWPAPPGWALCPCAEPVTS